MRTQYTISSIWGGERSADNCQVSIWADMQKPAVKTAMYGVGILVNQNYRVY